MKKLLLAVACTSSLSLSLQAQYTIFTENFDVAPDFLASGWSTNNLSNPLGTVDWVQGNGIDVGTTSYNGDTNAYVTTNYLATTGTGSGTISDWMISPVITFNNGDTVSFYTISYNSHTYPDRMEVRLSQMGASTNVGVDENSVGDFTTLLVTVNPLLDTISYPSVFYYGNTWTQFYGVVSGLGGPTAGRLGFRYFVTDGGGTGANSSTIAVDAVRVSSNFPAAIEEELNTSIMIYPNPATDMINISVEENLDGVITLFDMKGNEMLNQTIGGQNNNVDISTFTPGNYMVKITENHTRRYTVRTITKN